MARLSEEDAGASGHVRNVRAGQSVSDAVGNADDEAVGERHADSGGATGGYETCTLDATHSTHAVCTQHAKSMCALTGCNNWVRS